MTGWGGKYFAEVCPEGFSLERAQEFVDQLLKHATRIFDEIRAYAQSPENYVDWDELEPPTENLVGN